MSVTIVRDADVDDDGSGTTGTVRNNAWKTAIYQRIDDALALLLPLAGGTLTGNIKFPVTQVASADANTLDDYAEGSWTPGVSGSTSGSGQTYSSQSGRYLKIGRLVFMSGSVVLTAKGTLVGGIILTGLPFTATTAGPAPGALTISYLSGLATNWVWLTGYVNNNTTVIYLWGLQAAGAALSQPVTGDLTNAAHFDFSASYLAAA